MNRPLFVTDCDEVLLYMVSPFAEWLGNAKNIDFDLENGGFEGALTHRQDGRTVEAEDIWPLLGGFFDTEMATQLPMPGAVQSLATIAEIADVVILTNLTHERNEARRDQLKRLDMDYPVVTNQGEKGPPLAKIIEEHRPSVSMFVDDLPMHHKSASLHTPDTWRLHMIGEEKLAPQVACAHKAKYAHNRLDTWADALPWILEKIEAGEPAPSITSPKPDHAMADR